MMSKLHFAQQSARSLLIGVAAFAAAAAAITMAMLYFGGFGKRPGSHHSEASPKAYGEMTAEVKAMLINLSANGYGCTLTAIRYAHMRQLISVDQRKGLADLILARNNECRTAVQIDILNPQRSDRAKAKETKDAKKAAKH